MQKYLRVIAAVFVLSSFLVIAHRISTADHSGTPAISTLRKAVTELGLLCAPIGMTRGELVNMSAISVTLSYSCSGIPWKELELASRAAAVKSNWVFKEERKRVGTIRAIYCNGRNALDIEIDDRGATVLVDQGVYWTPDRGSWRYCSDNVKPE